MKTLKIGRSKLIKYSLLLGSIFLFAITFPPLSTDVSAAKLTESNCESSGGMWRGNVPPGECAFTDGYGDTIVKDTGDLKAHTTQSMANAILDINSYRAAPLETPKVRVKKTQILATLHKIN